MAQARRKSRSAGGSAAARYVPALLLVVAALVVWSAATSGNDNHPDPRSDVTAAAVVQPDAFAAAPDIAATYAMAQEIPQILDGIYCHCDCSLHSGHRSLLSCFESDHGAWCDVCLEEVRMAYRMHDQGHSLAEIRAAIDERWRRQAG